MTPSDASQPTAELIAARLETLRSPDELEKYKGYFKFGPGDYGEGDTFMGVRMGQVFALAKEFVAMPPMEIETLLESDLHEMRAGAVSIMDKQARSQRTPETRKKELYDLYLRRMDRINTGTWLMSTARS